MAVLPTSIPPVLSHVEIYVSDLERSASFWGWFLERLGYKSFQSWPKGRSWKMDGTYIVFVQAPIESLAGGFDRRRVGLNHLAFNAASRMEVDTVTDALRKQGVRILYEDRHPYAGGNDHYGLFFEDPDGIKVELRAE